MRSLLLAINLVVLVTLGVFAKDNVRAFIKTFLLEETPAESEIITDRVLDVEVVFSPKKGATKSIIKAILEAKKSIVVAAYSFTSQEIAKALLDAKKKGVVVRLILDKSQTSERYSSSTFFAHQGFDFKIDTKHAIFHNKFMVIDDKTVITGSFNFTKAAENKNAENVLIIRNNPEIARLYTQNWLIHWNEAVSFETAKKRN